MSSLYQTVWTKKAKSQISQCSSRPASKHSEQEPNQCTGEDTEALAAVLGTCCCRTRQQGRKVPGLGLKVGNNGDKELRKVNSNWYADLGIQIIGDSSWLRSVYVSVCDREEERGREKAGRQVERYAKLCRPFHSKCAYIPSTWFPLCLFLAWKHNRLFQTTVTKAATDAGRWFQEW